MRIPLLLTALSLVACDPTADPNRELGGQFGEESGGCEIASSTALALSEASPIGVSASDVLALAPSSSEIPLTWEDGETTAMAITFSPGSTASFLTYTMLEDCPDAVEVDGILSLTSDDGELAESIAIILHAEDGVVATSRLPLTNLQGSFDPADQAPSTYDSYDADLELVFDSAISGRIVGWGTTGGDLVLATQYPIATF